MAEAAAQERRRPHLPEQPVKRLGPRRRVLGQESAELFGEVEQDRPALEHALGLCRIGPVEQRRNLRIGVQFDEARTELVALADVDVPGVIFRASCPAASNSSSMIVTFCPLGVPSE